MKKLVNFKFVVLFALLMLTGSVMYGQDHVIDEVVWVVGDEAILKSDVEEARMNAQYEGRKFEGDPYCVIPEELAIQKLYCIRRCSIVLKCRKVKFFSAWK